ncbi:MAG: hypothetical protein COZ70_07730, partial [Deltaproteobacteria bacterium CG_4_8_14_3_um_filter_51_11]
NKKPWHPLSAILTFRHSGTFLAGIQKYGGVDSGLGHAGMTRLYAGMRVAGIARLSKLYEFKNRG